MDTIRNDNYLSGFKSGLYQLLPLKIGNTGKPIDTFSISPRTAGHRITRRIPPRNRSGYNPIRFPFQDTAHKAVRPA